MRAYVLIALAALAACSAGAQTGSQASGSAQAGNRVFQVGAFDRVSLAGSFNLVVTPGAVHAVREEGDPELLERLEVEVDGSTLEVRTRNSWGWNGGSRGTATVYVTAPVIEAARLAGSGDLRVAEARGRAFSGAIAGSGTMSVDRLETDSVDFAVSGSGDVRAAGRARSAQLQISGSGDADLSRLALNTASVRIAGSGDARVQATERAAVTIAGSGSVDVQGGARCTIQKAGSGEVRCG